MPNDEATAKNISSAEMTAYWRSQHSEYSEDVHSQMLVSEHGAQKAVDYCENKYPLASLQMSIRAGFFLQECLKHLRSGLYDSIISFGSGFSLLTLVVVEKFGDSNITAVDTDLQPMMEERCRRISNSSEIQERIQSSHNIKTLGLDLEAAFKSNKSLSDFLPENCEAPIFVVEGLLYFLSIECQNWLLSEIKDRKQFNRSAVVLDYWPENSGETSRLFRDNVLPFFAEKTTAENVRELMSLERLTALKNDATSGNDVSLADAEKQISASCTFFKTDPNDYIPARFISLTF